MKKLFCLFIALILLVPMNALAIEGMRFEVSCIDPAAARGTSELGPPIDRLTQCYVPVTYKQISDDGVVLDKYTTYVHVANITYRFRTSINSLGKYTGGAIVASQGWPVVDAVDSANQNPVVVKTAEPTGYVVPINNGDGYRAVFYGGSIRITYNNVIYMNIMNEFVDAEQTTVTRVFSYTETGP